MVVNSHAFNFFVVYIRNTSYAYYLNWDCFNFLPYFFLFMES